MKQRVTLSTFSTISTLVCIAVFVILMFYNHPPVYIQLILAVLLLLIFAAGLFL